VNAFDAVVARSGCIFAAGSQIDTVARYDGPESLDACYRALRDRLPALDGAVVELADDAARSLGQLARTVGELVVGLSMLETGQDREAVRRSIPRADWRMRVGGEVVYPIAFASCYPVDSSRYTFGVPGAFLLIQSAASFTRRHSPHEHRIGERARAEIRARHAEHGRAYDLRLTLSPFECHKVIKPLKRGASPIAWW